MNAGEGKVVDLEAVVTGHSDAIDDLQIKLDELLTNIIPEHEKEYKK